MQFGHDIYSILDIDPLIVTNVAALYLFILVVKSLKSCCCAEWECIVAFTKVLAIYHT
jgi:hypothetical protein